MNKLFVLVPVIVLAALVPLTLSANAAGLLHFKPDKGALVKANTFLAINGTSAPSNATHTKCNVMFQTNQHGYMAVTPQGPRSQITKSGGLPDFTKWSASSGELMKVGNNTLEAQIMCFPPGAVGNIIGTPNLIHHLVHNVTGR